MGANLANRQIKQVFVLMLENRSFDHMLGFSASGAAAGHSNSYLGTPYDTDKKAKDIMSYDPGHEFPDVVEQLCGEGIKYTGGPYPPLKNSGFVSNYATTKSPGEGGATDDFGAVMRCYDTAARLPVMNRLAEEFAVCNNWFASLPGPTWPNRFFVHAATSGGLDHSPRLIETTEWETIHGFSFSGGSIFDLLSAHKGNNGYRLYRGAKKPAIGCIPCVAALKGIRLRDTHPYEDFESDVNSGHYPWSYTFIEPNYGDIVNNSYAGGQSQHPNDDVRGGEALIKSTYEAIRKSPLWESSMLLITYDEHGGFFDHVAPPAATAPGDTVPHSKYN